MKRISSQFMVHSSLKVFVLFPILCLLFAVVLVGCAKREIKNLDSKGANVICFGDSITFGYGVKETESYPQLLAGKIHVPVINAGIDGDTSSEALKRLESDVLERDPLLVIIEFGGNDFLRKIPKQLTLDNISEMVERIQNKAAMVAIADISAGVFLNDYRQQLYKLARDKGAIFVPRILSGIITNPRMRSDFLHPNAEGYSLIAQRTYCAIIPYLEQNAFLKKNQK